ncbi:MAG: adenylate/guanylate cyclase domain-containing protein [Acidiferrobacterales bacterium]|nr:adenylate/guanylate cyclase domain-containing protein [Acidiferrobacterales bacterium]
MRCPKCQAENEEGRRFCAECGASLGIACPDCGFANRSEDKFCGGCGRNLTSISSGEAARKHDVAEPERRQLTVMFCDLVDSTALAERLDPEDLRELLSQYQDTCADVIQRYEGYIARYVGDGLLMYFGYPQAHEADAERAIRAALGIVDAIQALDGQITHPGITLAVRIGITTGLVVAGDIGSGERVEENAIVGETPNLAARLQGLAEPNTVVVGANTQRLVEGLFDYDDLGPQRMKGMSGTVVAYRVRGESGVPSRFEAVARRGLTPLVGREEEIGLLLKRWEQAKEGEGQVVLLSGEAGAGKSRINQSFRERLKGERYSQVLYYCSPYHQHSAFYPAIEQLARGLRFEKNDTPKQKLDKLDAVLGSLGLPATDFGPVLASFLSLPAGERYPPLTLSPEDRKSKTVEAMVDMIEAMTSQQPVLMVVEDAQWIDPSTLELMTLLIDRLRSARFLMLVTSRPEFAPPWRGYTHVTALILNRLSRKECATMVKNVTEGKTLPQEILDQIVAKTDGVPLYIEELTKNLLESGLLDEQGQRLVLSSPLPPLAIPASLQDSLMARLDRLARVKSVAQLAAALGRTFSYELLAAVTQLKETALNDALAQLVAAGLIYRRGVPPAAVYEFKHALVQDAAYQSLLKSTREHYHLRIARVLENRFPQVVETQPEFLAHHYTAARLAEQAIGYWRKAAEQAAERAGYMEAFAHLERGLELIKTLPDSPERAREEIAMYLRQAESLHFLGRREEIISVLLGQQERIAALEDPSLAGQYYFWLGWAHAWLGHRTEAIRNLSQSLSEAKRSGENALMGRVHRALALECTYSGRPLDEAVAHARQAVSLLAPTADVLWFSQALFALSYCCYYAGDFDEALDAAVRLDDLGETMGSRRARAESAIGGLAYATRGDWTVGIEVCQRALDIAPDPFETAFVLACLGKSYSEAGDMDRAVPTLEQAVQLADQVRSRQWCAYFRAWLGEAYLLAKQLDKAKELLGQTLETCTDLKYAVGIGWCHHLLGRVAQARGDLTEAGRHLDEAVQIFQLVGAKFELARTYLAQAEMSNTRKDPERVRRSLGEARSLFRALRTPKYVESTQRLARSFGFDFALSDESAP